MSITKKEIKRLEKATIIDSLKTFSATVEPLANKHISIDWDRIVKTLSPRFNEKTGAGWLFDTDGYSFEEIKIGGGHNKLKPEDNVENLKLIKVKNVYVTYDDKRKNQLRMMIGVDRKRGKIAFLELYLKDNVKDDFDPDIVKDAFLEYAKLVDHFKSPLDTPVQEQRTHIQETLCNNTAQQESKKHTHTPSEENSPHTTQEYIALLEKNDRLERQHTSIKKILRESEEKLKKEVARSQTLQEEKKELEKIVLQLQEENTSLKEQEALLDTPLLKKLLKYSLTPEENNYLAQLLVFSLNEIRAGRQQIFPSIKDTIRFGLSFFKSKK